MSDKSRTVVALGTFDGVHLGHRKILAELKKEAAERDLTSMVVTFFPHPTHILTPENPLKMINSLEERVALLKEQGIDRVIIQEFSKEFSQKTALSFIREGLIEKHRLQTLLVGYNQCFGKNKEGNFNSLSEYGKQYGFNVKRVEAYTIKDIPVSSSLIRDCLSAGAVEQANTYLSYPFRLFGTVVRGNQLGRKIGFHTANIVLEYPNKIVPKKGVYTIYSTLKGKPCYGMMNIGYRPTVNGKTQTIEAHYFNLKDDLYDQKIEIKVLFRLRDESKFENMEALKNQLFLDKEKSLEYIKNL